MVTHPRGDHSVISIASRKRKAIDLDTTYAESIFLQQNHRSKNIIICQKITKHLANKTVTHHLNFFF